MAIKILIASPLRPYTGADEVEAAGDSLGALLDDLDARYPGIRFRMIDEQERVRRHMRVFINRESISDLDRALAPDDEVMILHALSGG